MPLRIRRVTPISPGGPARSSPSEKASNLHAVTCRTRWRQHAQRIEDYPRTNIRTASCPIGAGCGRPSSCAGARARLPAVLCHYDKRFDAGRRVLDLLHRVWRLQMPASDGCARSRLQRVPGPATAARLWPMFSGWSSACKGDRRRGIE
jgi:hypothetical protein